jgi:hypothetical protein
VKGQALGGFSPDAWKLREFGYEVVDGAHGSERQRQRKRRHFPHLGLERLPCPALALGDGRQDEVGQQLLVPSFERSAIDRQSPDSASTVQCHPDHPTTDLDFDCLIGQIPLQLLQPALHLLAQLE